MAINRRNLIKSGLLAGASMSAGGCLSSPKHSKVNVDLLDKAASAPILKVDSITSPVKVASIEMLHKNGNYFVLSRSTDGAEGISITNSRADYLYPIFNKLIAPCFIGADARDLEKLIDAVYLYKSNYKLTSPALWCPVAWIEFSLLDMLGKIANKPVGELMGGIHHRQMAIYSASGNRHTTPTEEADILKRNIERTHARAVKFKVGGRILQRPRSVLKGLIL